MSTAILTIDDVASANTPALVDYLCSKDIYAVMFATGVNVEKFYDEAIYALRKGMIVGNHSYSHIAFSDKPYGECIAEIEKNEVVLDRLYRDAGVPRLYRPFRFPYGDKGNGANGSPAHYKALQAYLREQRFTKLEDTAVTHYWYHKNGLTQDVDTYWTFDFAEYQIPYNNGFTADSVIARIHDAHPTQGGVLLEPNGHHIILFHAHDETEAIVPRYYELFLDECLRSGVEFVRPVFR